LPLDLGVPLLAIGLLFDACTWSRDNPLDPARCSPRCGNQEKCREGTCVSAADGAALDTIHTDGRARETSVQKDKLVGERSTPKRDFKQDIPHNTGCSAGDKMWCESLSYGGWGQVDCDPATGKWKTKTVSGKTILDCQELTSGLRPSTPCACFFFYFNPSCCEHPDCVVPAGNPGQLCPKGSGDLCSPCNPNANPSDCKETGAICIVTNQFETFCGRLCSETLKCPDGYTCMSIMTKSGKTEQCVPNDNSCFYAD